MNLSVIVPHYNCIDGLDRLLNTIPRHDDTEIIVIDDKSDGDEYEKITQENCFDHVLFLNNTTDISNAGRARNIGIEYARGKWLLFADSDDFFLENAFNTLGKYFESENDIIFFLSESWNETDNSPGERHLMGKRKIFNYKDNPNIQNEKLLRLTYPSPCSKLIKKSMVDQYNIRFDEQEVSNDRMFSLKCGLFAKRVNICTIPIYSITERSGSLTTHTAKDKYMIRLNTWVRCNKLLLSHNEDEYIKGVEALLLKSQKYGFSVILKTIILAYESGMPLKFRVVIGFVVRYIVTAILKRSGSSF